jgi:hypothetical protein
MSLNDFKAKLKKAAAVGHAFHPDEAAKHGLCYICGEEALPKCYSEAGRREYFISQTCEPCFDSLFKEIEK